MLCHVQKHVGECGWLMNIVVCNIVQILPLVGIGDILQTWKVMAHCTVLFIEAYGKPNGLR